MIKPRKVHAQPLQAIPVEGEVVLIDGVATALTPEAAEETAPRLLEAAQEAKRQREQD
jgi:hypothetical protein